MFNRKVELPGDISCFLFGPRQTGKTTLINGLFVDKTFKVNLLLNSQYLKYSKDPDRLIKEVEWKIAKGELNRIVIDEIQRVPALLDSIQHIIDNLGIPCILTGSSARKLKRGMANLLGGRAIQRFLFPFTLEEIRDVYSMEQALVFGTLPPVVVARAGLRKNILHSYVETYIREEIYAEGIVRKAGPFARFLDMAAAQYGEQVSYSEVARECQLPIATVKSYYEILEDTLIGLVLHPWRKSIRKRMASHPKVYFFDNGVSNALNRTFPDTIDSLTGGRLFKQFVVNETHRLIKYSQSPIQMFFWRTGAGAEVDLILERNGGILAAFEIKFSKNITGAHLKGLRAFREEYPEVPCYVISRVEEPFGINRIQVINWPEYQAVLNQIVK